MVPNYNPSEFSLIPSPTPLHPARIMVECSTAATTQSFSQESGDMEKILSDSHQPNYLLALPNTGTSFSNQQTKLLEYASQRSSSSYPTYQSNNSGNAFAANRSINEKLDNEAFTISFATAHEASNAAASQAGDAVLPGEYDVISGRSSTAFNNVGNRRFRCFISRSLPAYLGAKSRSEKSRVIQMTARRFQEETQARFLKAVPPSQNGKGATTFVVLSEKHIRSKVGHALRDMAAHRKIQDTKTSCLNDDVVTTKVAKQHEVMLTSWQEEKGQEKTYSQEEANVMSERDDTSFFWNSQRLFE